MGGCCSKNTVEDVNKESTIETNKKPNGEVSQNGKKPSIDHQTTSDNLNNKERIESKSKSIEENATKKEPESLEAEKPKENSDMKRQVALENDQNKDEEEKSKKKTSTKRIRRKKSKVVPSNNVQNVNHERQINDTNKNTDNTRHVDELNESFKQSEFLNRTNIEEDGELLREVKSYSDNNSHFQVIKENNEILFSTQKITPTTRLRKPVPVKINENREISLTEKSQLDNKNEVTESKQEENNILTEPLRSEPNSNSLKIEGMDNNTEVAKEQNPTNKNSSINIEKVENYQNEEEIETIEVEKNIPFENTDKTKSESNLNKSQNDENTVSKTLKEELKIDNIPNKTPELDRHEKLEVPESNISQLKEANLIDEQIEEWKSLVESLMSNHELISYAKAKPRKCFKQLREVGEYLEKCSSAKSLVEKAWLVYVWVTDNIDYDFDGYRTGNVSNCSSQSVLETGYSVCEGYSNIFQDLCAHLNVECFKFSGYSKGFSYRIGSKMVETNHAWNAIPCGKDGKLRFIDSTWGSGYGTDDFKYVKRFQPYYFATPDHVFNQSHFSDSYNSFEGIKKKTLIEFENATKDRLEFYILGLKCLSDVSCMVKTSKNPFFIEYSSPKNVTLAINLIDESSGEKIENMTLIQSQIEENYGKHCLIAHIPEKEKNYLVKIFGIQKDSSNIISVYDEVTSFSVRREGDEENTIPAYNLSYMFDIKLKSHQSQFIRFGENPLVLEFDLPERTNALFKLTGKNGSQVDDKIEEIRTGTCLIVNVNLPLENGIYTLSLFAGNGLLQNITQFHLLRFK